MREPVRTYRRVLLVVLLLLAMMMYYSASLRHRGATSLFERTVLALSTPLLAVVDSGADGVAQLWHHYLWLVGTQQENDRLRAEQRLLQARLERVQEVRLENERLKRLLAFAETRERPVLPAQVVAEDLSNWSRTVLIDKGSRDGLHEGLPVVVAEGIVGHIIKCASGESRVLLVTDASSALGALVQRTRTRGVARGRGDTLVLEFALREGDVVPGDAVMTSGMGGVYPKGLRVGTVTEVVRESHGLFQSIQMTPAADFSRLEEVLVLLEPPA